MKGHPRVSRGLRQRAGPLLRGACIFGAVGALFAVSMVRDYLGVGSAASRRLQALNVEVHVDANLAREEAEQESRICGTHLDTAHPALSSVLLSWGIFYMFWALAIVCDDYFVASLEVICERLQLSDGVAGATFMAAGSSAPELFTSIMGVFAVKNDVGVGTIVGSAVFNLCCIIGGTAFFSPKVLDLDWRPLVRDSLCYALSVIILVAVIIDGHVGPVESVVCLVAYCLYVSLMVFNERLMTAMDGWAVRAGFATHLNLDAEAVRVGAQRPTEPRMRGSQRLKRISSRSQSSINLGSGGGLTDRVGTPPWRSNYGAQGGPEESSDDGELGASSHNVCAVAAAAAERTHYAYERRSTRGSVIPGSIPEVEDTLPEPEAGVVSTVLKEPLVLLLECTLPSCERNRRVYLWTFVASCAWIGALSYLMVTWATKLGCILGIHPAVMGVTVLAAGTSVPDAISSLIVAARGQGDMAVSNAIGSNVFDILLGLGLPWAVSTVCMGEAVAVDASNLAPMAAILFGTLVAILGTIVIGKFRLSKPVGGFFFGIYFLFAAYVIANELGAFG